MIELSVTQYAIKNNLTRQAVLYQIKDNRLPENVSAKRIGNAWVLEVKESEVIQN